MINKISNRGGFTLIEILASIVLLTVVISMFLSTFPHMSNINNRTGDNLEAANVAKELLVKFKNYKTTNDNFFKVTVTNALPPRNNLLDPKISTFIYDSFDIVLTIYPKSDANVNGSAQSLYLLKIEVMNGDNTLTTTHGYLEE